MAEAISIFPASKVCFFLNERDPRTHNIAERSRTKDIFERSQFVVILTASLCFSAIEDASTAMNLINMADCQEWNRQRFKKKNVRKLKYCFTQYDGKHCFKFCSLKG